MESDTAAVLAQLNQARDLGLSDKSVLPQVVKQILNLVNNPNLPVQAWCAKFLREVFTLDSELVPPAVKIDLAIDALPALRDLSAVKDIHVFKDVIDTSVIVFKLSFRFVAENDGSHSVWQGVNELKNSLMAKFDTQFPFEASYDREHDMFRNIDCKLELLKFIVTVIDYQLRSISNKYYSLARVSLSHTLIKTQTMENEALALVDGILRILRNDVIVAPLITATLNHLAVLVRRKRQFVDTIIVALDQFDALLKLQSNYESLESYKLSVKYVERTLRVLFGYMTKLQLVPPKYQAAVGRKLQMLTAKGDEIRKKNILEAVPLDSSIKKRKFEGFVNNLRKLTTLDYKNLYCLTDINNELNSFDFSTIPQHILASMALTALSRAPAAKLSKALEIISARYTDAVKDSVQAPVKSEGIKRAAENDEDDADGEEYNAELTFTLPPPQILSFQEKKDHVSLIVKNFFDLAAMGGSSEDEKHAMAQNSANLELTRVAISSWKQDSWLVLLTRLATRGMHTVDSKNSTDSKNNEQLSDIIRKALFDYFLANIHDRVDMVIEWLNEEWYNEMVVGEQSAKDAITEEWTAKYEQKPNDIEDLEQKIQDELEAREVETPTYNKWAQQVMDSMVPFLEPTDRKIFLRLLSDLPALTPDMIGGIKSLCADPVRSKLGFLALQFLIMYRPPAKPACLDVLRSLKAGDQEDLRAEAEKLLAKYEV